MPSFPDRPLGAWARRLDALLTARMAAVHHARGLDRLDWQILHVLATAPPATLDALADVLRPFATADSIAERVSTLDARGLVQLAPPRLTEGGTALHDASMAEQEGVRACVMEGVSEADYATTLAVLKRMVGNLERAAP